MSAYRLIGHFLKENGHTETLKKLEQEYGHPIETAEEHLPNKESLQQIINDRIQFNELHKLEQLTVHDQQESSRLFKGWSAPYPRKLTREIGSIADVVISVALIESREWLALSTSKQQLVVLDLRTGQKVMQETKLIGNVVIKKVVSYKEFLFLIGMDGKVSKYLIEDEKLTNKGQMALHKRLVIDATVVENSGKAFLVSVGWDKLLKVTDIDSMNTVHEFELWKQCDCFDVMRYHNKLYVVVGYTESTLLDVIQVGDDIKRLYKISTNDAEFTTAGFTPRCIKISTVADGVPMVAIATSHEPYMRLIVIKLDTFKADEILRNQIVKNVLTMSPQDKFSQPQIAWRTQGRGVWVVGEDGVMRGVDLVTGDIVEVKCHESRIKSVLTYEADAEELQAETLVTLGGDGQIRVWQSD